MLKTQSLKNRISAVGLLFVVLLVGCSSTQRVKVDFDQNTEIDTLHYKTFAWLTSDKIVRIPEGFNPVMKARVDEAIEQAFIKRGYQLVTDPERSDFVISYSLGSRDKINVSSYPAMYQGIGWGRHYYGGMATETHVRQYTEGSLAIDIFDVKSHQPVWHGWATKRISSKQNKTSQEEINSVVEEVISHFK